MDRVFDEIAYFFNVDVRLGIFPYELLFSLKNYTCQ